MNFFFDRTWGPEILGVVADLVESLQLVHHDSHFKRNTMDEDWIREVARWPGPWFVVTGDFERVSRRDKVRVLQGTTLTWFVLTDGFMNQDFDDQDQWLSRLWLRIVDRARHTKEPTIYAVRRPSLARPIQRFLRIADLEGNPT